MTLEQKIIAYLAASERVNNAHRERGALNEGLGHEVSGWDAAQMQAYLRGCDDTRTEHEEQITARTATCATLEAAVAKATVREGRASALGVAGECKWGWRYDHGYFGAWTHSTHERVVAAYSGDKGRPVRILDADVPVVVLASAEPVRWGFEQDGILFNKAEQSLAFTTPLYRGLPEPVQQDGAA